MRKKETAEKECNRKGTKIRKNENETSKVNVQRNVSDWRIFTTIIIHWK